MNPEYSHPARSHLWCASCRCLEESAQRLLYTPELPKSKPLCAVVIALSGQASATLAFPLRYAYMFLHVHTNHGKYACGMDQRKQSVFCVCQIAETELDAWRSISWGRLELVQILKRSDVYIPWNDSRIESVTSSRLFHLFVERITGSSTISFDLTATTDHDIFTILLTESSKSFRNRILRTSYCGG